MFNDNPSTGDAETCGTPRASCLAYLLQDSDSYLHTVRAWIRTLFRLRVMKQVPSHLWASFHSFRSSWVDSSWPSRLKGGQDRKWGPRVCRFPEHWINNLYLQINFLPRSCNRDKILSLTPARCLWRGSRKHLWGHWQSSSEDKGTKQENTLIAHTCLPLLESVWLAPLPYVTSIGWRLKCIHQTGLFVLREVLQRCTKWPNTQPRLLKLWLPIRFPVQTLKRNFLFLPGLTVAVFSLAFICYDLYW